MFLAHVSSSVDVYWWEIAAFISIFIPGLLFNSTVPKGSMTKKKRMIKGALYTGITALPAIIFSIMGIINHKESVVPSIAVLGFSIILIVAKAGKIAQSQSKW